MSIALFVLAAMGLSAGQLHAQVGGANNGGFANPSIGAGNMAMGANVANAGSNMRFGSAQPGAADNYPSTMGASQMGGATNIAGTGGSPLTPGGGFYGQNNNTAVGSDMSVPNIGTRPGMPLSLPRGRGMFNRGESYGYGGYGYGGGNGGYGGSPFVNQTYPMVNQGFPNVNQAYPFVNQRYSLQRSIFNYGAPVNGGFGNRGYFTSNGLRPGTYY